MSREDADREISTAIRDKAEYYRAPSSLLRRVLAALPDEAHELPRPPAWPRWLLHGAAYVGVALLTWAATMGYLRPGRDEARAGQVLASHVGATLGKRLYEVASSDQHAVKPWLSARLAYSPPVADLSAQGFDLLGARVEHVGGEAVAVLVYRRRLHIIDAYVWPARTPVAPYEIRHDGFNVARFAADGMEIWAVSDLNRDELIEFARLIAGRSAD